MLIWGKTLERLLNVFVMPIYIALCTLSFVKCSLFGVAKQVACPEFVLQPKQITTSRATHIDLLCVTLLKLR